MANDDHSETRRMLTSIPDAEKLRLRIRANQEAIAALRKLLNAATDDGQAVELRGELPKAVKIKRRIKSHQEGVRALRKLLRTAVERDRAVEAMDLADGADE